MKLRELSVISLGIAFLLSCHRGSDSCPEGFAETPQGYFVKWVEYGTTTTGLFTIDYIQQAHSDAIDRAVIWFNQNHNFTLESGYAMAHSIVWELHDIPVIIATDGVTTAAGEYVPGCDLVRLTFHHRRPNSFGFVPCDQVPLDAPQWTILEYPAGSGQCRWGEVVLGDEFPALRHELGHALLGACFEHNCLSVIGR